MQSLERLTMEHALMGRGLGALEILVRKVQAGEAVPKETVQELLDFFEIFGDRYHHVKEEHVLIPEVEEGCESRSGCHFGPTLGALYYDHEVARRVLRGMRQASANLKEGASAEDFAELAEEYIAFMRLHIAREKDSLIRAASWKLSEEDERLTRSFDRYEEREALSKSAPTFAATVDRILAELSVVVPPPHLRAYSRGTIPYHRSGLAPIRY